ncbi:MAG: hypothetical protein JST83_03650 [Bacteroidetes bacterium]|nr:hypothetical protein [Bacteroidota bacterium]
MKYILTIALSILIFTAANAQTPTAKENTQVTNTNTQSAQAPAAAPAEQSPAQDATAGSGPHISANFVGTNDLNLLLLREGIKKA